ncbi:MAG: hypothetical protein A3B25_03750 [Candidatus Ryanbacteria bacterium RIFCSPLOWO2_01_FULL_48_26]|uniref:FAD/NAD(P)-binding domain-containing protein n=1 Tax=Candidatus Ryanbacteria bacterium RIFCSPLOWO2_01_FULL_48_26 TaxID=1802126 RepID=A0A1G2GSY8_9BACT|nr:MAG: hypothetical protein A3B25_03750 [Candidatus Ryanbacteria bacterium RIFCSPLOWO2_01_FULL_48_26]
MDTRKKIAILGAGFGGLRVAKVLAQNIRTLNLLKKYEVLLIDKSDRHTYTPLLYEIATTSKEIATLFDLHSVAAYNTLKLLKNTCIRFIKNEIAHIDPVGGAITLADGEEIKCQYIVLALGSEANYFNIPGLKEYALPFKTFSDAIRIRDTVWDIAMENPGDMRIAIGGGGSTGVELAAEFKNLCGQLEKDRGCGLKVTLIESSACVLQGLDRRIVEIATKRLEKLGVNVATGEKISMIEKNRVVFADGGKIDFDVFIWTGGVKAPTLLSRMQIQTENQNRAIVGEGMECLPQTPRLKLASQIYGLGDSICFYDPITKRPIPGVARAAISQASVIAWNITQEVRAAENPSYTPKFKTYKPREYPYIIPVGGKFATAKIGPIILGGTFGWILKGLVELSYLFSIMPSIKALQIWLKGLSIFLRNEKLG